MLCLGFVSMVYMVHVSWSVVYLCKRRTFLCGTVCQGCIDWGSVCQVHIHCGIVSQGYIVFSGVRRSKSVQGLRVIVQSNYPPHYVEGRVEAFLQKMEVTTCFL